MVNYSMEIIKKPKEGTVTVLTTDKIQPFFKGEGDDNYLCGTCTNVICQNVNRGQVKNIVFVCPKCESYNILKGN